MSKLVTSGEINVLRKKLQKIYQETGGQRNFDQESEIQALKHIQGFDARKVLIAKKIQATRETIALRDELYAKKGKTSKKMMEMRNKANQMVKFVRDDFMELKRGHQESLKSGVFKKKKAAEQIEAEELEIGVISLHVRELEALSKRVQGVGKSPKANLLESPLSDKTIPLLSDKYKKIEDFDNVIFEEDDLPDDARQSDLPALDISGPLNQVKETKKKMEQGLDDFSKKLDILKERADQIHDELEVQDKVIGNIDTKVDDNVEKIEDLNKRVNYAIGQVSQTTRMMIIAALSFIVLIILFLFAVYIFAGTGI